MKYILCPSIFIITFLISVIIFYHLDFFKTKDCNGNYIDHDWSKIIGYAFLPSFSIFYLLLLLFCYIPNKKKFKFDNDIMDII